MHAVVIRLFVLLGTLAAFYSTAERAFADEPGLDCGSPSEIIQDGWVISSPKQQGFDPGLLCVMGKGVMDGKLANVDSIVVVRHGVLVYERYFDYPNQTHFDATVRHAGNSMIKSVISLLVGIELDHGLIKDLDAPVLSYFPEYSDLRSPEKDRITLRHLLTMSAGLEWYESDVRFDLSNSSLLHYVLEQKVVTPPGQIWNYNSGGSAVIGEVLSRVTGTELDELARTQLFEPLGIDDVEWRGSELSLRPRDWAKIGQLVLNHGVWQGKQIVPASWIVQSTTPQIKAREPFSYGFQWWLGHSSSNGGVVEWTAAMGYLSQKTIIIPDLDLVVVFNASHQSKNMVAPEIELLDSYVLPASVTH
jgi:CubicO group peptidase (beta-lactamase class C family)